MREEQHKRSTAAIYIRVSTLDQAQEGYSLEAQKETLKRWCAEHNHIIYDIYEDPGISGKAPTSWSVYVILTRPQYCGYYKNGVIIRSVSNNVSKEAKEGIL